MNFTINSTPRISKIDYNKKSYERKNANYSSQPQDKFESTTDRNVTFGSGIRKFFSFMDKSVKVEVGNNTPEERIFFKNGNLKSLTKKNISGEINYLENHRNYRELNNGNIKVNCEVWTKHNSQLPVYLADGQNFQVRQINYKTTQILDRDGNIISEYGSLTGDGALGYYKKTNEPEMQRTITRSNIFRLKYEGQPVLMITDNKGGVLKINDPKIQKKFTYLDGSPIHFDENNDSEAILNRIKITDK